MVTKRDFLEVINALIMAVDSKDHYTMVHSLKVMDFSQAIAKRLRLSKREMEKIRFAALLHDIGKIAIPDSILQKPEKLTGEEFEKVMVHPREGAKIVGQITLLRGSVSLILNHHERWDGSGYPEGKKDDEIPLGARILAVADTYSALISDRPYRSALSPKKAQKVLKELNLKEKLDAFLTETFLEIVGGKS